MEALVNKLGAVDAALTEARDEKTRLEQQAQDAGQFISRDDIAARLDEALMRMVLTSFEFAGFLRRLLPGKKTGTGLLK